GCPAGPAQRSVELALDRAAQRGDRLGIAEHRERLDRRGLDAEIAVAEEQLDTLADIARFAIAAAAREHGERSGGGAPALRRAAPLRALDERAERAGVARTRGAAVGGLAAPRGEPPGAARPPAP